MNEPQGRQQRVGTLLSATIVRGLDAFLALETEWRDLFEATQTANPFMNWEWVSEWARTYWGDDVLVVRVSSPSDVVALSPFYVAPQLRGPAPRARHLQLFGPRRARNLLEMGTVLVDPAHAEAAFAALADALLGSAGWDWIEVAAVGDDIAAWDRALSTTRVGTRKVVEKVDEVPVMRLADDWAQTRRRLRRNLKESIRHAYNSPQRANINYTYREVRAVDDLDEALDDFFRLHRERAMLPGRPPHPDHFAQPSSREFLRRALRRLVPEGRASVGVVEVEQERVAVRINLETETAIYLYFSGFDPRFWRHSVMTYAVVEGIKSAIGRELKLVNFSPGVDQAKSRWDVQMVPLARFAVVAEGRSSRLRFAMYRRLRSTPKSLVPSLRNRVNGFPRRVELV